ncbi:MAG: hypothetical protein AAFZ11_00795 [Pseudomonadota bacterium]
MNTGALLADAKLFELSPLHIDVGNRIGFYHEDKAVALGRLMAVDGQRDPIKVRANPDNPHQPWKLVTGMHRVMGARIESSAIWAIEVSGEDEDFADLEASENLHRRPLGPIERAKFTAALVQAAQERIAREHGDLNQYQRGAKARWDRVKHHEEGAEEALRDETEDACAKIAQAYSWEESVGEAMGLSRRTIHNDLALFRLLIEPFPELIEELSRHPVVGENASQLKKIAGVKDQAARRRVIEKLLADPEIKAEDAMIAAGVGLKGADATPVAHQKHFDAIEGGWSRLSIPQKRQFLPKIRDMLTEDMKRELRAMLDEELG